MISSLKIQIAKMNSDMKLKSDVVDSMRIKVEELSVENDYYKKEAYKIQQLEPELWKHKKVLKDVKSKLERKTTMLSDLQKEATKLKDQVCLRIFYIHIYLSSD